jgi:hypothetical protein
VSDGEEEAGAHCVPWQRLPQTRRRITIDLIYITLCILAFLFVAWIALALFGQSLRERDERRIADQIAARTSATRSGRRIGDGPGVSAPLGRSCKLQAHPPPSAVFPPPITA